MTASELRAVTATRGIELFDGLSPSDTDTILAAARHSRFPAKSVITLQSDPAHHFLMLWSGRARYFFETPNGKKLILIWIVPGHIFGGMALVSRPSTYLVSTEAVRDSIVLDWPRRTIRELAQRFPRLLENALLISTKYLSWYVAAHAALGSLTARERLASVLLELGTSIGERVPGGIELDATNEELASSANITPYTTSRLMREWQVSGAIAKRRKVILLRSPESFFRRAVQSSSEKSAERFVYSGAV